MRRATRVLFVGLLWAGGAWADHRAFTVEASGAWSAGMVPALQTTEPHSTLTFGPSVLLGLRYGVTDNFELSASGLFDTPVTVAHSDVVLNSGSAGNFPGTLVHDTMRAGGMAGARLVLGSVFRLHLGLELGWAQRFYSALRLIDTSVAEPRDYGLSIPNTSTGQFLVSPLVGLEWAAGDHWSFALLPRGQLMLGAQVSWTVLIPLQFSWSFYI